MKILFLDIETAPNIVYTWSLFTKYIDPGNIVEPGHTICWSAKFKDSKDIDFCSIYEQTQHRMIVNIHRLLDEADVVVHYNGSKFDIPTLNREFIRFGMTPPSSYKQIDLLKVIRKKFKFQSNKLDYICKTLGLGGKVKHRGMDLWKACLAQNKEAWLEMKEYNIQDVILLEKLYYELLPWIDNHPNHSNYTDKMVCPNCGSIHVHKRGFTYTNLKKYQRYQCYDCGKWSKAYLAEKKINESKNCLLGNI